MTIAPYPRDMLANVVLVQPHPPAPPGEPIPIPQPDPTPLPEPSPGPSPEPLVACWVVDPNPTAEGGRQRRLPLQPPMDRMRIAASRLGGGRERVVQSTREEAMKRQTQATRRASSP